jgi:hypothetical protein
MFVLMYSKRKLSVFWARMGSKTTLETLEYMKGLRRVDDGQMDFEGRCGVHLQTCSLPNKIRVKEPCIALQGCCPVLQLVMV